MSIAVSFRILHFVVEIIVRGDTNRGEGNG